MRSFTASASGEDAVTIVVVAAEVEVEVAVVAGVLAVVDGVRLKPLGMGGSALWLNRFRCSVDEDRLECVLLLLFAPSDSHGVGVLRALSNVLPPVTVAVAAEGRAAVCSDGGVSAERAGTAGEMSALG